MTMAHRPTKAMTEIAKMTTIWPRERGLRRARGMHGQLPGLRAMTVLSLIGMVVGPLPGPKKPITAESGVTSW